MTVERADANPPVRQFIVDPDFSAFKEVINMILASPLGQGNGSKGQLPQLFHDVILSLA